MSGYLVYFLLLEGCPVYIGHTRNIKARMNDHNKSKVFDCVRWMCCVDKDKALYYEKRWQQRFKPYHNINGVKDKPKGKVRRLKPDALIQKVYKRHVRISISLGNHEFEAVKEASETENRSIGNYITWCILRGIRNDKYLKPIIDEIDEEEERKEQEFEELAKAHGY